MVSEYTIQFRKHLDLLGNKDKHLVFLAQFFKTLLRIDDLEQMHTFTNVFINYKTCPSRCAVVTYKNTLILHQFVTRQIGFSLA